MRTRAKTWMLLLSILVAGTALMWPAEEKILVETATVQSGELVQTRLLTGVVQKEQKQYIISPKSGLISSVYVPSGQAVEAGQMLLRMDTSAEEKALSRLYLMRFEKANAVGELADQALTLMSGAEDEWMANEAALLASVQASAIRADAAGESVAWYVQEGEYAAQGTLLGVVEGYGLQVKAADSLSGAQMGMYAQMDGIAGRYAVLTQVTAPVDAASGQTLVFTLPDDVCALYRPGEMVQLELVTEVRSAQALIPLSAIDADGNVWYVEDGVVCARTLEQDAPCSRLYSEANEWWKGKTVVLNPDSYGLQNGTRVGFR